MNLSGIELWIVASDEPYYPQVDYFTSEQAARDYAKQLAAHRSWSIPTMVAQVVQLDGEGLDYTVYDNLNPEGWWGE